jgi:hypothetical protein
MSELSSQARALLSDGRGLLRPSFDDRARVASALARRLGTTALVAASVSHAASASASSWSLVSKLSSVIAAVGLVGAGAAYSVTHQAEPSVTPNVVAHAPVHAATIAPLASPAAPVGSPEAPAAAEEDAESLQPASRTAARAPRKEPPAGLTAEVALLSRATSQLRSGDAVGALEALEQHRRQFPTGKLLEERLSARAQALCLLGARGEAEVELKRLARVAPRSSHLARAERACKKP